MLRAGFPDNTVSERRSEQPNHAVCLCDVAAPRRLVHPTRRKHSDALIAFVIGPLVPSPCTCTFGDMQWHLPVCVFSTRTGKCLHHRWILMCCQLDFSQLIVGRHSESDSLSYVAFVLIFQLGLVMLASRSLHLLSFSLSLSPPHLCPLAVDQLPPLFVNPRFLLMKHLPAIQPLVLSSPLTSFMLHPSFITLQQ